MTALRLGLSELRRLASGRQPRLAILAMVLVPTMYAGLYLFANHDPYGNLHEVPAAVVVRDVGTTVEDPQTGDAVRREYGRDVAEQLVADGGFGWVVTSEADAQRGVRSGRYDAALVIEPRFSSDLASAGTAAPRQASMTLVTNDANNYLARTIADQIVGQVRDSIARQVGTEAADTFLRGYATLQDDLGSAIDGATDLADGAAQLGEGTRSAHTGAGTLADGAARTAAGADEFRRQVASLPAAAARLDQGADQLSTGLTTLDAATSDLPEETRRLADGAARVAAGNAEAAAAGHAAAAAADAVVPALDAVGRDLDATLSARLAPLVAQEVLTQAEADALVGTLHADVNATLSAHAADVDAAVGEVHAAATRLDELAAGAQQVADGNARLADAASTLADGVSAAAGGTTALADGTGALAAAAGRLADGATRLADGTAQVSTGATALADGTLDLTTGAARLADGAGDLRDGLAAGLAQVPDLDEQERDDTAAAIADPVTVRNEAISSARTYAGGLAPFFLSLALWIGAYMLFLLVRPLSTRALAAGHSAGWTALGGWLVPAGIGVVQVVAMFAVTRFALDIDPAHAVGTVLFLGLVSLTFVAVLQALNVWLGVAGQLVGIVLMLIQLVTAGGTFPWQTIPEPLRSLHHVLPMSYSVDGLRQLLYGGSVVTAWGDAAVLAAVLVIAMGFTVVGARRQRVWTVGRIQPELVI